MNGIIYKVSIEAISRGHDNMGLAASRELDVSSAHKLRSLGDTPEFRALIDEISSREDNLRKDGRIPAIAEAPAAAPVAEPVAEPAPVETPAPEADSTESASTADEPADAGMEAPQE